MSGIDYNNMLDNCLYGLKVVQTKYPSQTVRAHGYVLFFKGLNPKWFNPTERRLLAKKGWEFTPGFGLTFPTVG